MALFAAHERAAGAIARLDQALDHHPLLPAFLHRVQLEAVRRQAAVDGRGIDPWHLAAVLEGLRLRMDHALRIVDRGEIFEAARTALALHQWITEPDFDQEGEVLQAAEHHLAAALPGGLLGAAEGVWSWLHSGRPRPPIRSALVRFWGKRRLLRVPVPLTGPRALSADAPVGHSEWVVAFLEAVATEAADYLELLRALEHGWLAARSKVVHRRSTSRAPLAVDVLAAAPLMSATTLARAIGMSIKSATELLDRFVAADVAVEVTHRSARRLFGLARLAPLRDVVQPPVRPHPSRGPGRPRHETVEDDTASEVPSLPPLSPIARPSSRLRRPRRGHGASRCGGQARPSFAQFPGAERPPSGTTAFMITKTGVHDRSGSAFRIDRIECCCHFEVGSHFSADLQFRRTIAALRLAKETGEEGVAVVDREVGMKQLDDVLPVIGSVANVAEQDILITAAERYGVLRRFSPRFLEAFDFRSGTPNDPVLAAIELLKGMDRDSTRALPDRPPSTFLPPKWRKLIFANGKAGRRLYETAVAASRWRGALRGSPGRPP